MVKCRMICCSQVAPKLLVHVSLLLVIIAGAGVATLARLKWDPSTYLIFRGFLPDVYRMLSAVLCFASGMLILLAHIAVFGLTARNPSWRRAFFITYLVLMLVLIIVELGTVGWLLAKIIEWIRNGYPKRIIDALLYLFNKGRSALRIGSKIADTVNRARNLFRKRNTDLSVISTIINIIDGSVKEIIHDLPFNLLVGVLFIVAAIILQPLAVLLALNAVFTRNKAEDTSGEEPSQKVVNYIRYNSENAPNPVIHKAQEISMKLTSVKPNKK